MNRNFKILSVYVAILFISVLFQNCGEKEAVFSSIQVQDLGTKGGGNCVQGQRLGVWLDANDDGSKAGDTYLGSFVAYVGDDTAKDNYNFYSASAHPIIGPQPEPNKLNVFFYEGSDGLALNFYSNIDKSGSENDVFDLDIEVHSNNSADSVLLSDDPRNGDPELVLRSSNNNVNYYEGRFEYWLNTDGGVIGPLITNNFEIKAKVLNSGRDIDGAAFYSSNGEFFSLSANNKVFSSFIVAYKSYEDCQ